MKACGAILLVSYQMERNSSRALLQYGKIHCAYFLLSSNVQSSAQPHCGFLPLQMLNKTAARSSSCSEGLPSLDSWTPIPKVQSH